MTWGGIVAVASAAAIIHPANFTAQAARICATFLGLFAAGILPTISLLLQSVNSNGKSVYKIADLEREITSAIDDLFRILGCAGVATFVLLCLSINTPDQLSFLQWELALQRVTHGFVAGLVVYVIARAGRIPSIIRRALAIKFQQARFEAEKATRERAPAKQDVKAAFPRNANFGKSRKLDDKD